LRNASTPVSCNYSDKYYELQNRGFTFLVRIYNEIPQTKVDFSFTFTESTNTSVLNALKKHL